MKKQIKGEKSFVKEIEGIILGQFKEPKNVQFYIEGIKEGRKQALEEVENLKKEGTIEWDNIEYQDGDHTHTDTVQVFKIELWKLNKLKSKIKEMK